MRYDMKGIGIIIMLILVSGVIMDFNAFAFSESPNKDEKQFVTALYLVGFVGIYGGVIYLNKSQEKNKNF